MMKKCALLILLTSFSAFSMEEAPEKKPFRIPHVTKEQQLQLLEESRERYNNHPIDEATLQEIKSVLFPLEFPLAAEVSNKEQIVVPFTRHLECGKKLAWIEKHGRELVVKNLASHDSAEKIRRFAICDSDNEELVDTTISDSENKIIFLIRRYCAGEGSHFTNHIKSLQLSDEVKIEEQPCNTPYKFLCKIACDASNNCYYASGFYMTHMAGDQAYLYKIKSDGVAEIVMQDDYASKNVRSLHVCPNGSLITTQEYGVISRWNMQKPESEPEILLNFTAEKFLEARPSIMSDLSADGKKILIGLNKNLGANKPPLGILICHELHNPQKHQELIDPTDTRYVSEVKWMPDNVRALCVRRDEVPEVERHNLRPSYIQLWDFAEQAKLLQIAIDDKITSIDGFDDGRHLYIVANKHRIALASLNKLSELTQGKAEALLESMKIRQRTSHNRTLHWEDKWEYFEKCTESITHHE